MGEEDDDDVGAREAAEDAASPLMMLRMGGRLGHGW